MIPKAKKIALELAVISMLTGAGVATFSGKAQEIAINSYSQIKHLFATKESKNPTVQKASYKK